MVIDLSKAFDCLPHDLILLKLEAYGLSEKSINLLNSYLSGRKQCAKVKNILGPKIEPCGTPLYTVSKELQIFFTFAHCFLPDK
jgi:hypothetical protein